MTTPLSQLARRVALAAATRNPIAAVASMRALSTAANPLKADPEIPSNKVDTAKMEKKMAEINQPIEAMQTNYAVDAPDGESDGHIEEELEEVKHIIDDTGKPRKKPPRDDDSADPFGIHIH